MRHILVALVLAGSACAGYNFGTIEGCEELCAQARSCGFLPSALGWSGTGEVGLAEVDCVRRCGNSSANERVVATIEGCFAEGGELAKEGWCEDEADEDFAGWSSCAQIDRCLGKAERGHQLLGEVAVTVQVMSFADYDAAFVDPDDAIADQLQGAAALYPAVDGVPGCPKDGVCDASDPQDLDCSEQACPPKSCARALCGESWCKSASCVGDECEADPTLEQPCDTALCRVGRLSITQICTELGAQKISVELRESDRPPVVQVFQDKVAEINASCETSTLAIAGEDYKIKPGPIVVSASVHGELSGEVLLELGLRKPEEVSDPAALLPYCFEFVGPPVVLRAGENRVALPIASLAEVQTAEVELGLRKCPV